MSISYRTLMFTVAAALALPLLGGCGGDDDTKDVTRDTVEQTAFAKDFRAQFPKLALDISDATLDKDAAATCDLFDDAKGTRADVIADISERFTVNGIKPNDTTVVQIANLAIKDACPDRAANMKAVL